jgi:hypothetical protein
MANRIKDEFLEIEQTAQTPIQIYCGSQNQVMGGEAQKLRPDAQCTSFGRPIQQGA